MISAAPVLVAIAAFVPLVASHACIWHPSMWGFNVTAQTYPYDNRPLVPLQSMTFDQWWFHGHLDHPPNAGDFFELPAGGVAQTEIACDKGLTSWYASSPGGKAGFPTNDVCLGQPSSEYHTNGINDLGGCGLGITYKSDVTQVQPEDFAIFTTNATCVWTLNTDFQVPAAMPACPDEGCICAFFWIHQPDSGSEQMYMNGFRCKVTGASGTTPIGQPAVARRCGADPANGRPDATPSNCTVGPKQPLYWFQQERNNMFEGTYSPPLYLPLYGWESGAQDDIFQAPTVNGVPVFGGSGASVSPPPSNPPPPPPSSAPPSSTPPPPPPSSAPPPPPPSPSSSAPPPPSSPPAPPAPSSDPPPPPPPSSSAPPPPPPPSQPPVSSPTPASAPPPPAQPAPENTTTAHPIAASLVSTPENTTSANPSPAAPASTPAATKQCKSKKKRGVPKRHVKKRLSHDLH